VRKVVSPDQSGCCCCC